MPGTEGLDRAVARDWIERWERQQEVHLPDREDRFTAMIDAVTEGTGVPDPVVIDLGCGPGSLAVRLLDRIPDATVVAVDADPVMLALAGAAHGDRPRLRFVDLDLRESGRSARLGLEAADAAVSTTALHWLYEPELRAMYTELARLLRPGGLLLDGDHLGRDEARTPTLARLERSLLRAEERRRFPDGHGESWTGWWEAVASAPIFADAVAQRQRRDVESGHHGSRSGLLDTHVSALRAAGFAEVGTVWQRGDNRVLCAVR